MYMIRLPQSVTVVCLQYITLLHFNSVPPTSLLSLHCDMDLPYITIILPSVISYQHFTTAVAKVKLFSCKKSLCRHCRFPLLFDPGCFLCRFLNRAYKFWQLSSRNETISQRRFLQAGAYNVEYSCALYSHLGGRRHIFIIWLDDG